MTTPETNKKIVQDFFEAFSAGDLDTAGAFLHDDLSWWFSGSIPGISGTYDKSGFLEFISGAKQMYKAGALRVTPLNMIAEGNQVSVETESYAELKQNGRVFRPFGVYVFELADDNRIIKVNEHVDSKHVEETFMG